MRIEEICTRDVVSIEPDVSLVDAAATMRGSHVGSLVVCNGVDGELVPVGFLTDRDIVVSVVAMGLEPDALRVKDVMTSPAIACRTSDDVFDAILTMRRHGVRRLPVIDGRGALAGLVSADDIWSALARQLGNLSEALTQEQVREMRRRA